MFHHPRTHTAATTALLLVLSTAAACHDDDPEYAGAPCAVADDCYPDIDPADLAGEAECIDRVDGGYCTHLCTLDEDCCAVEGECISDLPQLCSPFESTGETYCFLSCERADIGDADGDAFCQEWAHPSFHCRSSGGGSDNRKICVPPGS